MPTPGLGNISGRSDIRDTIFDDFIASAYFRDQSSIEGDKSILTNWFSINGANDRGKRAKVALLAHGNEPIRSANEMHDKINNDRAGYFRIIDAHEAFGAPINLHITPHSLQPYNGRLLIPPSTNHGVTVPLLIVVSVQCLLGVMRCFLEPLSRIKSCPLLAPLSLPTVSI